MNKIHLKKICWNVIFQHLFQSKFSLGAMNNVFQAVVLSMEVTWLYNKYRRPREKYDLEMIQILDTLG